MLEFVAGYHPATRKLGRIGCRARVVVPSHAGPATDSVEPDKNQGTEPCSKKIGHWMVSQARCRTKGPTLSANACSKHA